MQLKIEVQGRMLIIQTVGKCIVGKSYASWEDAVTVGMLLFDLSMDKGVKSSFVF